MSGATAGGQGDGTKTLSVPQRSSFHYVELPTGSLQRAQHFYRTVFGWDFEQPPEEHERIGVVYYEARPEVGLCTAERPGGGTGIRPAIAVDSIEETLSRVEAAGGRSIESASDVGDGYTGAFEDTEGNRIALWAFK
jgi:predicted enzyme related to lactoylglutathione lyase